MSADLTAFDIGSSCVCFGIRRAARAVSRRYDEVLRPLDITSGQFAILAALLRDRPVALGDLAETLAMDRTTLSRNLKPLLVQRLVGNASDGLDRRVRALELTPRGRDTMKRAIPLWQRAQVESVKLIGEAEWPKLREALRAVE